MKRWFGVFILLALLPVANAGASSIQLVGTPASTNLTGTIHWNLGGDISGSEAVWIGAYQMKWTDPAPGYTKDSLFYAFCVDAFSNISMNQTEDIRVLDMSRLPLVDSPGRMDPPYAQADAGTKVAYLLNTYYADALTANYKAAALAMSIWEVINDTDFSVSNARGRFWVTGISQQALDLANNTYLKNIGTGEAIWLNHYPNYNSDGRIASGQDYGLPVPEPTSMLLLGSGLLGLAGTVRRRMQK